MTKENLFEELEKLGFDAILCEKAVLNYSIKGKSEEEIINIFKNANKEKNSLNNGLRKEGFEYPFTNLKEYYKWK